MSSSGLDGALLKEHLPSLDGVRAISIIAVMLYHSFGIIGARLGVSAFFVLSGFLITWLLFKELSNTGYISLKDFYYRRTLRILPPYICFLLVVFITEMLQGDTRIADFVLPSCFYYYNYYYPITGNGHPNLGHTWSLCVEEQFYIIWPLVFMFTARRSKYFILIFLVLVIVGGVLWRSYAFFELHLPDKWLYRTFDSRFDNLAVGCLLAVVLHNKALRIRVSRLLDFPVLVPIFLIALVVSRLIGVDVPSYSYTLGFSIEAMLIGLILLQCLANYKTWYFGWLNNRSLVFIGTLSYAMYLYHELAAGSADKVAEHVSYVFDFSMGLYETGILGFLLTVIAAYFSYVFVEKPILRLRKRRVLASTTEEGLIL